MKRNLFSFLFSFLCLTLYAQTYSVSTSPQPQGVLLEEFTGVRCQYCPEGHAMGEKLKTILGDRLSIVTIHAGHFASVSNPKNDYRIQAGQDIADLLGVGGHGFPNGSVNRNDWNGDHEYVFGRYDWTVFSKRASQQTAPVNLWAEASYDANTRKMDVKVEGYFMAEEAEANQRLHLMLVQNHISGPQTGSSYSTYEHQHMLRAALNGTYGELLKDCRPKTYFSRTYTYDIPETYEAIPVKAEDLELVIFVTGEDGRHVANSLTVKPVYHGDALPLKAAISLNNMGITDNYLFPYVPVILENRSNVVLTSAKFSVTLNNESNIQEWKGNIPAFGKQEILLPFQWDEALNEQNIYFITLEGLNGRSVNDPSTLSNFFHYNPLVLPKEVIMKHHTTPNTQDNAYTLYDIDSNTQKQFGPYENNSYYTEKLTLVPGHRYCLEVTSKWMEGYAPEGNFLELCNTDGTPLTIQRQLTDFGFRIFFQVEGEMEPPVETCYLDMHLQGSGTLRVNNIDISQDKVLPINKGETVRLTFLPEEGYRIGSFKLNGVECAEQIQADSYSFEMNDNKEIDVSYENKETGIHEAEQNGFRVYNELGRLVIQDAEAGQVFSIYTLEGKSIFTFQGQSETLHLDLPKGQAYIVKSAGKSFKVIL